MILVDANILVYSHVESFAQHKSARDWLDQQLSGSTRVGLPWVSLLAFLRVVTNPRVFERPEPMLNAWRQVRAWLTWETVPNQPSAMPRTGTGAWAYAVFHGWRFRAFSGITLVESARSMSMSGDLR
ncbi:MAG: TA system VapC family ribonuclease toxin [Pseudolabrys sp.]